AAGLYDQFGRRIQATNSAAAGSMNQIEAAIHRLGETIKQTSSVQTQWLTQAIEQSKSLSTGLGSVAEGGQRAGFSMRYLFFGIKDIAEGRGTYALAELANILIRVGPAALAAGGGLALIGGAVYGASKLNEYIRGLPEAAAAARAPFSALNDELEIGNA